MKQTFKIISWVRDKKGKVIKRPLKDICNAITSMSGGGYTNDESGMANTTPYVLICYESKDVRTERQV